MDIKDVKDLRNITLTKEEYVKLGKINKYLPLPPKKAMMQMWEHSDGHTMLQNYGYYRGLESVDFGYSWTAVGAPFEFVYPEDVK
jgi:hypothetical protein